MTWADARAALDTGQRVLYQGRKCVIVGVAIRRKTKRDLTSGEWRCVGEWYYGADIIDATGHISQVRADDLTVEETRGEKDGH